MIRFFKIYFWYKYIASRNQFINTSKWNSDWIQLKLKSDNLAIVAAEIERMSDEDQDKENMSFSVNAMWLMNADEKNETQKSLSKMIQNFENLFHWELMKIERTDKIFAVWKKLKCIILMHILNMSFRQTMTTKMQDTAFSYAEMLKMKSNLIIKAVFKWIE